MSAARVDSIQDTGGETRKGGCSSSRGMMPRQTRHSGKKEEAKNISQI